MDKYNKELCFHAILKGMIKDHIAPRLGQDWLAQSLFSRRTADLVSRGACASGSETGSGCCCGSGRSGRRAENE